MSATIKLAHDLGTCGGVMCPYCYDEAVVMKRCKQEQRDVLRDLLLIVGEAARSIKAHRLNSYTFSKETVVEVHEQLLALRADIARLTWLEQKRGRGQVWECRKENQSGTFSVGTYNGCCVEREGDVRSAIDEAMKRENDSGTEV